MKFDVTVLYKICPARVIFVKIGSVIVVLLRRGLNDFLPATSVFLDRFA